MDVQSLIQDTMLDNIVALLRTHATGAQGVPGRFTMALNPFLNVLNILKLSALNR
jgi:hypothetical protein